MDTVRFTSPTCSDLVKEAMKLWNTDLDDISREPLPDLLNLFKRDFQNWHYFRDHCFLNMPTGLYDYYDSAFAIALLKLAVAIENKTTALGVLSEEVKSVVSTFSDNERNAIREFEKYKSLDPNVTPPKLLAEYIVSKREGIYDLVKEAVDKQ